jgi:hypothetical protein
MDRKGRTTRIRFKFRTRSWAYRRKFLGNLSKIFRHNVSIMARMAARRIAAPPSFAPHAVGRDFFGINVAPSLSRELEDYHYQCLRELGVTQVRTDYAYDSDPAATERWIDRLAENHDVLVHLVQPSLDAARMDEPERQGAWLAFLRRVFARFAGKVRLYEIGSTPNRHSWSGYSIGDYVTAFALARGVADEFGVELIGPNISDFAPYFMAAVLGELRRRGIRLPLVSDNLFVDRAGAPESFDPHVLGAWAAKRYRWDLVRKSRLLDFLSQATRMGPPICTYVYWTISPDPDKERRRYVTEEQYANYMTRYFVYSAAAGHLHRIYWGQMSGFFKGIVDDGARLRFDPPAVYQRLHNEGSIENYRKRPAFQAFRVMVEQLADTRFVKKWSAGENGAYVFEFEKERRPLLVAWALRSQPADWATITGGRPVSRVVDRDGIERPNTSPLILTERPLYLIL